LQHWLSQFYQVCSSVAVTGKAAVKDLLLHQRHQVFSQETQEQSTWEKRKAKREPVMLPRHLMLPRDRQPCCSTKSKCCKLLYAAIDEAQIWSFRY